jgi:hypothetical protein
MEVTIIGLQNAGKTSLLRVLAVSPRRASSLASQKERLDSKRNAADGPFRAMNSRLSKNDFYSIGKAARLIRPQHYPNNRI